MAKLYKVLAGAALLAAPGCFGDVECCVSVGISGGSTSPAVYGIDARVAPGFGVGDGDVTVHPLAGYSRSLWGGVDGETDNIMHLGGQVRAPVSESGLWLGGEGAYARRWTSLDGASIDSEATNGWTLTGLAGIPLSGAFNGYAAAGWNKYGGSGWYARLGFELSR